MAKRTSVQNLVSVMYGLTLGLSALSPVVAVSGQTALEPMFRIDGPVAITPPSPWRMVSKLNRDPLSVAQWAYGQECSFGASRRLTLFNVDIGTSGPQKLIQRWFASASRLQVLPSEAGFILVKAYGTSSASNGIVAFPESDRAITPLPGWIGGVKVVLVGEAASAEAVVALESELRATLRSAQRVSAKNSRLMDQPYVLAAKTWNRSLAVEIKRNAEKKPMAKMSLAFGHFYEASGFVPAGQDWLRKAAESGHAPAQVELLRLSRANLLTTTIELEQLELWKKELAAAGHVDEQFIAIMNQPYDADESQELTRPLKALVSCGHRDAKMVWAKRLAESFNKKDRNQGKKLVLGFMQAPMLDSELPIYTRTPRPVLAPTLAGLQKAALLKAACTEEIDPELFVKKSDFVIPKQTQVAAATLSMLEPDPFPELKIARELDQLANSGDRKKLRQAQKLACDWVGSEGDRQQLVVEIRARRDGFGKWQRFRVCDVVSDEKMLKTCSEQESRQSSINNEVRFQKLLAMAGPRHEKTLVELRALAIAYADAIWNAARLRGDAREQREIDRLRNQIEAEFVAMAKALLTNSLEKEVGEALTAKRLLALQPKDGSVDFTLFRQPASAGFMRQEQLRLEARMAETVKTIEEADHDDLDSEFKVHIRSAITAWTQYKNKFEQFSTSTGSTPIGQRTEARFATTVWFYVGGIDRLEQVRDREMSRPRVVDFADL